MLTWRISLCLFVSVVSTWGSRAGGSNGLSFLNSAQFKGTFDSKSSRHLYSDYQMPPKVFQSEKDVDKLHRSYHVGSGMSSDQRPINNPNPHQSDSSSLYSYPSIRDQSGYHQGYEKPELHQNIPYPFNINSVGSKDDGVGNHASEILAHGQSISMTAQRSPQNHHPEYYSSLESDMNLGASPFNYFRDSINQRFDTYKPQIDSHNKERYHPHYPHHSWKTEDQPSRSTPPARTTDKSLTGEWYFRPPPNAKYVIKETIVREEDVDDELEDEEGEDDETTAKTEMTTQVSTTPTPPDQPSTPAPFTFADIKVPISFLRIEYMIGFTFFGIMYGLGFLVLFQSICVPVAKFFTFLSYIWAVYFDIIQPTTQQEAMQYLPPN